MKVLSIIFKYVSESLITIIHFIYFRTYETYVITKSVSFMSYFAKNIGFGFFYTFYFVLKLYCSKFNL